MNVQSKRQLSEAFEAVIESTPYYRFVGIELVDLEEGQVTVRLPHTDDVGTPDVGPDGIHGGVLNTAMDSAGMGSAIAQKGRLVPLATEDMSVTYHSAASETVLVEARVVSDGSTLVTSRVDVYPERERNVENPTLVASGTTTARLFE